MGDIVIRAEGLRKRYRIGERQRWHSTLRETMTGAFTSQLLRRSAWRRGRDLLTSPESEVIWALNDVSLEVKRGEIVGIIGRNAAGKSTLLKILSRITEPTSGFAEIRGRVGSLLEVGTGFHPQLTGRENIYLNGAILGMSKAQIERRFDEIVAFADVDRFLDTPVRHYSSGMHMRLAFSVAAHMEPEILLVDEVLAVGDFAFQKKCLGKMQDVSRQGRTVLFVSHSMGSVKALCNRCLLLENGKTVADGSPDDVVARYIDEHQLLKGGSGSRQIRADYGEGFVLHRGDDLGDISILCGDPIVLEFDIEAPRPLAEDEVGVAIQIVGKMGDPIVGMGTFVKDKPTGSAPSRFWRVRCDMGRVPMYDGTYFVSVHLGDARRFGKIARFIHAFKIHVMPYDVYDWGSMMPSAPTYWIPEWEIRPLT